MAIKLNVFIGVKAGDVDSWLDLKRSVANGRLNNQYILFDVIQFNDLFILYTKTSFYSRAGLHYYGGNSETTLKVE